MRLLLLLALVVALPASAQSWSMGDMLTEMAPVLVDAASTDFASLRGALLNTRGTDSLWASTYRPEGPSGPLYSRIAMNASVNQSMLWFSIQATDTTYAQRLFGTAIGTLNQQVGSVDEENGLGWMLAVAENSAVRKVVQWVECAQVGRVVEAIYQPTETGADVMVSVVRRGGADCPGDG